MLKVTNMKHGDDKFDICIMSDAIHGVLSAGLAECALVGCPLHKDQLPKKLQREDLDAPDACPELRSSQADGL